MSSVPKAGGQWESTNKHVPLSKKLSLHRPDSATYGFQEELSWRGRTRSKAFIDSCKEMGSLKERDNDSPKSPGVFALPLLRDSGVGVGRSSMFGGDIVGPFHAFPRLPPTAWFSSTCSCPTCHLTQELMTTQQIQSEALVKSLSRILSKLAAMDHSIHDLERYTSMLERVDNEVSLVASQRSSSNTVTDSTCASEEDSPDVAMGMYPNSGAVPATRGTPMLAELKRAISEAKEICLSSANLCFAGMSSPSPGYSGSQPCGPKTRLTRGNTITCLPRTDSPSSRPTSSSTQGYGLEPGLAMQERISPSRSINRKPSVKYKQMHSVVDEKDEWVESLRRTHSESELNTAHMEVCLGLDDSLRLESSIIASREGGEPKPSASRMMPQGPFQSYFMNMWHWQNKMRMNSITSLRSVVVPSQLEPPGDADNFITPLGEGLSADSKQMLEKIAQLESERMCLLDELNEARKENFTVWSSLEEVTQDLNAKEIHLDLLKRDLQMATTEIRSSTELRQENETLRKNHDLMLERLTKSQDESHTLKESLVRLLQEKSQLNQRLTLENQSLRAKISQFRSLPGISRQISVGEGELGDGRVEPVSLDNQVPCVYMQGFLTKQGHRVKNWKKRLFVLDNQNLTYYKAEQPQGVLSLSDVVKAQISRPGAHPNMFQVHTRVNGRDQGRIYFLSAGSHEEMQSWVGMLQALRHTRGHASTASSALSSNTSNPDLKQQCAATTDPPPPSHRAIKGRSRTAMESNTAAITLPRAEPPLSPLRKEVQLAYMPSTRTRMLSEGNPQGTPRLHSPFDTTDEEDGDAEPTENRSPFSGLSSDEESRTSNTEGFKIKHLSKQ